MSLLKPCELGSKLHPLEILCAFQLSWKENEVHWGKIFLNKRLIYWDEASCRYEEFNERRVQASTFSLRLLLITIAAPRQFYKPFVTETAVLTSFLLITITLIAIIELGCKRIPNHPGIGILRQSARSTSLKSIKENALLLRQNGKFQGV